MVIGAVAWSKANTQKGHKYNYSTGKREEIDAPIKYNEKVGTFTVPKANSIQTFSIKVRFMGETFGVVDQQQLEETAENARKHARNQHDMNQTVSKEDGKRRVSEAEMAEEKEETDLDLANAPLEHKTGEKLRRLHRSESKKRGTQALIDLIEHDSGDDVEFDEDSPDNIARQKETAKKIKEKQAELEKKSALAHKAKLSEIRKVAADKALADKKEKEIAEAQQPAKPGYWARGKSLFSRSKSKESGEKYKVEDEHVDEPQDQPTRPGKPSQPSPQAPAKPSKPSPQAPAKPSKPSPQAPAKPSKPPPKVPEEYDIGEIPLFIDRDRRPKPALQKKKGVRPASASSLGWKVKQQDTNDAGGTPASARPKTPLGRQDDLRGSGQDGSVSGDGGIYDDLSEDLDEQRSIYSPAASGSSSQAGSRQASALPTTTPRSSRVASARSHTTQSTVEAARSRDAAGTDAFGAAWTENEYEPSNTSSKTSRPASAKNGTRVVGSANALIEEVASSDEEDSRLRSRVAVQGRSASGTRASVGDGTTASSKAKSRSPLREPSSSRPASETNAQEGVLDTITANKARKDKTFENGFGRAQSDSIAFKQVSPRHTQSSQVSSAGIASHPSKVDDNKTADSTTPTTTKRFSKEKREKAHQRLEDMGFNNRGNKTSQLPPMDNHKKQAARSVSKKADDNDYDSEDSSPEAINKMMKERMNQQQVQRPKRPTDTDNFSLPAPQAKPGDPYSKHARQSNLASKGIFNGKYKL